ncbi:hypothetical protein [Providencia phage PSTRCR_120]|uniref:Uncharacterized protein n=1 Tax=Providencia phage PSTRCR_120 TaxID=2800826 RepID=A0A7T6ZMB3_9CAUD|nr:hypothetical protein [Providencia phage PSTRCR_120]
MRDTLSTTLITLCGFTPDNARKLVSYFNDHALVEEGDYVSSTVCYAIRELVIDQETISELPFLENHLGCYLYQEGTFDRDWGWEGDGDIVLQTEILVEQEISKDFNELLEKLGVDTNDESIKVFKSKWFRPIRSRAEV